MKKKIDLASTLEDAQKTIENSTTAGKKPKTKYFAMYFDEEVYGRIDILRMQKNSVKAPKAKSASISSLVNELLLKALDEHYPETKEILTLMNKIK